MILGFGKTEVDIARTIIRECHSAINDNKNKPANEVIELIRSRYNRAYDEYGGMSRTEVPERYSCFWTYESGNYIKFTFHHINRRHPFSPDGWAMLKTKWVLDTETGGIFQET